MLGFIYSKASSILNAHHKEVGGIVNNVLEVPPSSKEISVATLAPLETTHIVPRLIVVYRSILLRRRTQPASHNFNSAVAEQDSCIL